MTKVSMWIVVSLCVSAVTLTAALDNGLALTPPMGWLAWTRFRCNIDCDNDPDNCISERLFRTMTDLLVSGGYKDAGYEYLCVDDCWLAEERTADGALQGDPKRFPSGMKALGDYVHSKGLKFGIYADFGKTTCEKYPGSEFYLKQDAQTFADWGVDLLKLDGCYGDVRDYDYGYPAMTKFLNETGRPIMFHCDWPKYQILAGIKPNYTAIQQSCNLWRNYDDIWDNWDGLSDIINYYVKDDDDFMSYSGPGSWVDPDELIIGNFGLSDVQERVQMALWAMLPAPLIMSNDLRSIRNQSKQLLLNPRVIAINQQQLSTSARRITTVGAVDVWTRSILPTGTKVIALVHMNITRNYAVQARFIAQAKDIGLTDASGYDVIETFDGTSLGHFNPGDTIGPIVVDPTGVSLMTATPTSSLPEQKLNYD
ncbi:alpha-N-acetylgalactosaminidase-like [Haliotis rufescens]|uniref:alpha-N-acetylgalactosaminidase-like n=1 Tax=Haliotis rufescens TaxID=6454 RepID=UPI00201F47D7|nr:alpha-N-acetylgalactosaminidase-like [Haliotis rufescens]